MHRNLRTTSAYKLTLMAAVLALVFCVGLASYASTVSGTVTRGGVPCPNARVVLTQDGTPTAAVLTDANGNYIFSSVALGSYTLTFNAINAVPVIGDNSFDVTGLDDEHVTVDMNLTYGCTPLYDDFSGAQVDMYDALTNPTGKWEYLNAVPDATSLDVTAVSTENGMLNIAPQPVRGGIISTTAFPKYGSYECVLPRHWTGQSYSVANQCFCLTKDKDSWGSSIDLQDQGSSTAYPTMNCWSNGTKFWQGSPCLYPAKVTVLRTGKYLDVFVNNVWISSYTSDTVADTAYIYLYGYEKETSTTKTIAYFDDIKAGATVPVTLNTVAEARAAAADASVTISNVVVTASFANAFWVENTDRSSGIKVISTAKPAVGQKATISGKIVKQNNEVALQATDILKGGSFTVPAVAVTGKVSKELDKAGASAQGLFVKVAGKVSETPDNDGTYITGYYLDDGSGIAVGTHKGLYVKLADSVKLPVGMINTGDFLTRTGPLTVFMADSTTPVPSVITTEWMDYNSPATFTAYNDVAYIPGYYPSDALTKITNYSFMADSANGFVQVVPSGLLRDYATGNYVSERATISAYNMATLGYAGGDIAVGSDAEKYFADTTDPLNTKWIVNFVGAPYAASSGWWMDVTLEGLDPNAMYEFVGTVNRNESISNPCVTRFTILDCVDRTYGCSDGATKVDDSTVTFNTSANGVGYVARWFNIKPSANGTFRVRSNYVSGNYSKAYAIGGFRLRKQAGTEETPPGGGILLPL
ncbi:MAG: carboxypeptidase-like regulatory domain-containing protein [Armatimonadota bacterium]